MRGLKRSSPGDRPPRCPDPPTDRSESVTPLVSSPTGSGPPGQSPRGSRSEHWPSAHNAIRRLSGGSAVAMRTRACPISWNHPNGPGDRPGFPPCNIHRFVQLACLEPDRQGLAHHPLGRARIWPAKRSKMGSSRPSAIGRSKRSSIRWTSQPHRTRYWRTSRIDTHFKERAEKILWCYANAERLARRGFWVVCADEKPNFQVLERHPIRHSIPGSIAQREFDDTRHGTVNILFFLIVHSGQMEAACFDAKSAEHYVQELRAFRHRHRHLRGVYLIHDNDPTHTAAKTRDYLAGGLRLVAKSLHPGPRLVARRSGVVGRRIRLPLPEARIVAQSSRVHRLREASLAGVQSVVRPSIRMDMVESEDEAVG